MSISCITVITVAYLLQLLFFLFVRIKYELVGKSLFDYLIQLSSSHTRALHAFEVGLNVIAKVSI